MLTKVKNVIDITADTMADLLSMEHKTGSVQLLGYHERGDGGGGVFFWDDSKSQSEHNGGTIIAGDAVLGVWDTAGQEAWFTAPSVGTGCWVREYSGAVNVKWFGAKGDGVTNDFLPIQKVIDVDEKSIYLEEGAYYVGSGTFAVSEYTSIYGCGSKTKITIDSSNRGDPYADHVFSLSSFCSLSDLWVDGDRGNAIQQISSVYVGGGASDVEIKNLYLDNHGVGIYLGHVDRVAITGVNFVDNAQSKAHVVTAGEGVDYASSVTILDCYFGTCTTEAIDVNSKTRGLIVSSSLFFNNHTGGDVDGTEVIDIGSSSDCFDITISNNRCNNNLAADSFVWCKQGSSNVSITGNTIKNLKTPSGNAVFRLSNCKNVTISGNTSLNSTFGVLLQERSSTVTTENISVVGNVLKGVTSEGFVVYGHTNPPSNITVSSNHFIGEVGSIEGVNVDHCSSLLFNSNTVSNFGGDGIAVAASCVNVHIDNNVVSGCSDGVTCLSGKSSITNNTFTGNSGFGLRATAPYICVTGNLCDANGSSGILLTGANNCIVTGNISTNNGSEGLLVLTDSSDVVVTSNQFAGNTGNSVGGATKLLGASVNTNNIL